MSFLWAAALLTSAAPTVDDADNAHTSIADAFVEEHPEARPYNAEADADVDVTVARMKAAAANKHTIIVMGANWCHDSRALAGWFETPRFKAMLEPLYEIVYVDAGTPQRRGEARNQDIIKQFGGKKQKNTPYVMLLSPDGELLNKKDARSWRNAASRSEEEIYGFFATFTSG